MKIHSPPLNSPVVGNVPGSRPDSVPGSGPLPASTTPAGKAPVDLSLAARHLSNLQNSDNDINIDRINEIRTAIASGQLQIDPGRVAEELIASVRDLLK